MKEFEGNNLDMSVSTAEKLLAIEALSDRVLSDHEIINKQNIQVAAWKNVAAPGTVITLEKYPNHGIFILSQTVKSEYSEIFTYSEADFIPHQVPTNASNVNDDASIDHAAKRIKTLLSMGDDHPEIPLRNTDADDFWQIIADDTIYEDNIDQRIEAAITTSSYAERLNRFLTIETDIVRSAAAPRLIARLALYRYIEQRNV